MNWYKKSIIAEKIQPKDKKFAWVFINVPKEIIKFISDLYYKISDINKRNISKFPTIEKPTGITSTKSRPSPPSIPRTRSILRGRRKAPTFQRNVCSVSKEVRRNRTTA